MQMNALVEMRELARRKQSKENRVVSIGSPMLDIISLVDEEFLKKYNLESNNAIQDANLFKILNEEVKLMDHDVFVGGSVTNTARVLQKLLPNPKMSCHIGYIGKDEDGDIIKNVLKQEKVHFLYEEIKKEPTGRCLVFITPLKNRSMITNLGASKLINDSIFSKESIRIILENCKFLYASAFLFSTNEKLSKRLAIFAQETKKTFLFNIGAPFLCEKYHNLFMDVLPIVKVIFGNEEECLALGKILGCTTADIREVCTDISNSFKKFKEERIVIATRAAKPVVLAVGNEIEEFPVNFIKTSLIKDTTRAGDCFVGGFLSQFIDSKPVDVCVKYGLFAAKECIKHTGLNFEFTHVNFA